MSPPLLTQQHVSGALSRVMDAALNPSVPQKLRIELGVVAGWLQHVLDGLVDARAAHATEVGDAGECSPLEK